MKVIDKKDFRGIESIPQLIKDFLNADLEGSQGFLFSLENFKNKISEKGKAFTTTQREILFNEFSAQLSEVNLSETQIVNLQNLKNENTFTITTGHQLNLFSGPVFFVYKILQTIKTCEFLRSNFPYNSFVPVFWMATEDHDFDEINHFKTENAYYEIKEKSGGPVGRIEVTDLSFISEFEKEFKDHVFGTELVMMLKESYQEGKTLTQAIRTLVNHLFSHYGLLMLDGDVVSLKSQMKSIFESELLNSDLKNKSHEKVDFLKNKYGKVQVNPRDINLFYLSETRDRIEFDGSDFQIVDKNLSFTKEEILAELNNHPERFSPNAVMRPIYQETVLPNLAYVGGNAEIMYWLELQDYFSFLNLPFPILVPRNSMLFITEKNVGKIEKLQLSLDDFFHLFPNLVNKKLLDNHPILKELETQEDILINQFSNLKSASETTDQSFGNMVSAEKKRQLKSFDRFKKRLLRAEKIKQSEVLERLENLFLDIHPGKVWQERVFNFSVWYADFGADWVKVCYENMVVDESQLITIVI